MHEPGFVAQLTQENQQPFWFQMSQQDQQRAGSPWGPMDPQGLNRYSYVRNNPVRYVDPTGHVVPCQNVYCRAIYRFWIGTARWVQGFINLAVIYTIQTFGGDVSFWGDKIARQMVRRGWTGKDIQNVIDNPADTAQGIDRRTGDIATYYYRSDGYYVVRNDTTGEIIQVSDRTDPHWIDELTNQAIRPRP